MEGSSETWTDRDCKACGDSFGVLKSRSDQSKSIAVPENLRHVLPILNRELYAKAEVVGGVLRRLPVVQG